CFWSKWMPAIGRRSAKKCPRHPRARRHLRVLRGCPIPSRSATLSYLAGVSGTFSGTLKSTEHDSLHPETCPCHPAPTTPLLQHRTHFQQLGKKRQVQRLLQKAHAGRPASTVTVADDALDRLH